MQQPVSGAVSRSCRYRRAGGSFEHILRTVAERGDRRRRGRATERWIEQRLAQHRNPSGPLLHPQSDGRWIQISERKTQDGGTVGVFTEVTELKQREEELAKAIEAKDTALQLLQAALDSIAYGVLFMDADLRIRLANRAYREIWDMPEEFFCDHPSLRQDMEYTRRQGLDQVRDTEWHEYIAGRIKAIREGNIPPQELRLANNKVLQYDMRRAARRRAHADLFRHHPAEAYSRGVARERGTV